MSIPDLPRYIELDFLTTVLGIVLAVGSAYFVYVKPVENNLILTIPFSIGTIFFYVGFLEMFDNYNREKKLRERIVELELERLEKKK